MWHVLASQQQHRPSSATFSTILDTLTDAAFSSSTMSRVYSDKSYSNRLPPIDQRTQSAASALAIGIALYSLHRLLAYYGYPVPAPTELFWNALCYLTPTILLLDSSQRKDLKGKSMQAAKSEALRRMLGFGSNGLLQNMPSADGVMRRASFMIKETESDAPPGLGNWDNSCYQNSVLQGLASLQSLKEYLGQSDTASDDTTTVSLRKTLESLNNANNNGRQLWTPAKLKSMSSWQQQDAQEYFSKVVDELEKEAVKSAASAAGLQDLLEEKRAGTVEEPEDKAVNNAPAAKDLRNPLEGLLAQRVACTRCGFSEGLSMIPFNCLTVPIGNGHEYDVQECLDEYTKLEEISDVECGKCTLLRAEEQMKRMLPGSASQDTDKIAKRNAPEAPSMSLPPEVRAMIATRLQAVQKALKGDDYADSTLEKKCQVPKKARVSSTKTRQAVVGRAPQSLVVHINRSVFDEMTGAQRKNYARVTYPRVLDLRPWTLREERCEMVPTRSLIERAVEGEIPDRLLYQLKAVVTHYGRHENGHYICYRGHGSRLRHDETTEERRKRDDVDSRQPGPATSWWRLSDEAVSQVSEDDVLGQGGVFMLFYESLNGPRIPERKTSSAAAIEEPMEAALTTIEEEARKERTPTRIAKDAITEPDTSSSFKSVPPPPDLPSDATPQPAPNPAVDAPSRAPSTAPSEPSSTSSAAAVTDDALEPKAYQQQPSTVIPKPPTPPMMRTARRTKGSPRKKEGFGTAFWAVAAT